MKKKELKSLLEGKLQRHYGVTASEATKNQVYHACAMVVRDILMEMLRAT